MTEDLHLGDFTATAASRGLPRYFGDVLVELAADRPEIVVLSGDLTPATECDAFREAYPDRFYLAGIAEANMVGMAAGMARLGDIPFVHTFSVFLYRRALDQIAMQVAYPKTNVKLVGFLPGLSTLLGVSHQAIEDVAVMRALPNMTIIEPSGPAQFKAALVAALEHSGPVYLRMHRAPAALPAETPLMPLELGKGQLLRDGADGVMFTSGLMVAECLAAAETLQAQGIQVSVANMHTLKPLDREFVITHARRTGRVLTAENHSAIGGLGSAVADILAETRLAVSFGKVAIQDTFGEGGSTPYLFDKYGLSSKHIVNAMLGLFSNGAQ